MHPFAFLSIAFSAWCGATFGTAWLIYKAGAPWWGIMLATLLAMLCMPTLDARQGGAVE